MIVARIIYKINRKYRIYNTYKYNKIIETIPEKQEGPRAEGKMLFTGGPFLL